MGIISTVSLTEVDTTHVSTSVAGNATVVLATLTGRGSVALVQTGNGAATVNMEYINDGGSPVIFGAANVEAFGSIGFSTSIVIQSVNTTGTAANDSTISWTGVYH